MNRLTSISYSPCCREYSKGIRAGTLQSGIFTPEGVSLQYYASLYHDEKDRRSWQDPDTILADIGVAEGLVVIDIGCGQGFFALPAARRVGRSGRVVWYRQQL